MNFLIGHSSHKGKDILRNMCTAVTADASVNIDQAVKVSKDILVSITGMQVRDFKFSKKTTDCGNRCQNKCQGEWGSGELLSRCSVTFPANCDSCV